VTVAFIVEKFPNISETFILAEIVGLIRRGIDVDIFALTRGSRADIHPEFVEYRLADRTFYCVPNLRSRIRRLVAALPATAAMLRHNGRAFLACALARKRGLRSRTFVSLARAFITSGRQYDLVHAHFGPNGIRAQVLRQAGVFAAPLVTTFHGYDATSFITENGVSGYADLIANGDLFIAVSESMAQRLAAVGFPPSRTQVMRLGVDCRRFAPIAPTFEPAPVRVVSIGRFVEKKGFAFGIRAIVRARTTFPQLVYDIVGDGDLRAEFEDLVSELGAAPYITFHGYRDQSEIGAILGRADLALVPSVVAENGDEESMPIVIKEAMARGLPVVATRHAGIPEIVADGVNGILVPERDVDALAAALVRLSAHPAERLRLGTAARRLVETEYDNERLVDNLVERYRSLTGNARPALDFLHR
jgi:colanic acid/amylovoran biosynthesis glycosyltransferase